MAPGDRLVFEQAGLVTRDRPDLATLASWQRGRAIFDGQPLGEAVAEMNLYNPRPIVVADPGLLNQHVSGVYSTGDTLAFARSLTELFPARIEVTPNQIVLTSSPEKAP